MRLQSLASSSAVTKKCHCNSLHAMPQEWKTGDLVWVSVPPYPDWPGQIMDPKTALKAVQNRAQPGEVLVSFFGDSSFGWFPASKPCPLEDRFETRSTGKKGKTKQLQKVCVCKIAQPTHITAVTPSPACSPHRGPSDSKARVRCPAWCEGEQWCRILSEQWQRQLR